MSKIIDSSGILSIFLEEPNKEFHIRELAKIIKLAPSTATKYLNDFKKQRLLERRSERGFVLYKANTEDQSYKDIKLHYNIKKIKESGLVEFLIDKLDHPEVIILFGSFRKAENTKESDIDLFIISPIKRQIDVSNFQKKLGHEIQLFIHSKKEFEAMKKSDKELLNNVINGIVLEGFLEAI